MRKRKISTIALLLGLFLCRAPAEVGALILGKEDGLSVECEVCGYNVEKGFVQLRAGQKRGVVPFTSLSSNVQQRVVAWATDEAFASSSVLNVTIQERQARRKVDATVDRYRYTGKAEDVSYFIVMDNQSPFEMKNVHLECRIFYEGNGDRSYNGSNWNVRDDTNHQQENKNVIVAELTFDLPPLEARDITTSAISMIDVSGQQDARWRNTSTTIRMYEERLLGMHLTLKMKGHDGEVIVRTFEEGRVPRESQWDEYKEGAPPQRPAL